ncbi:sensor histidine kinase [Lachnoclostridium phytofermentans]|uniref:histidine kinase n=1 Tax=Lachnoclostridium phytofermentans (strain ATCC 700394 / DSM 18823 / ISDg) TaxID=357809 RepID=A9KIJ3_LACP7|nr:HAMP domain-containing sensor histidine kinase [Lachnoclostridium phytofermentans]ABX42445.1 integral membrane sensor signal transduction histidine kinase [Lachnoclostridium phytofermentans ISDg]
MMLTRNREVKEAILQYLIVIVIAIALTWIITPVAVLPVIIISLIFLLLFLYITKKRYLKLKELSMMIDEVLHGNDKVDFNDFNEGELSILQNEIKKMTIRLREQNEALISEKIQLSDSIADISHQLRTPLTSINLISSFLNEPELSEDRRLQLSRELNRLTSRIDWLVNSLLKLSKLDAGTAIFSKDEILVKSVVQKAYNLIAIPMELKGQEFCYQEEGAVRYVGDISWSMEAISNILKNCMEHTEVGGKLMVTAKETGIYTEIIIEDNGPGIELEDIPHLFERFYKGKNSSSDSIGIGLSLARKIIQEQNGTVKVENGIDCGAKFTIRFYKGVL